jgi:hypothetical protein
MRQIKLLIAALFVLLPFAASADVIQLNYAGEVTYIGGSGFGYAVDDTINGWFEYDTDDFIEVDGDDYFGDGPIDSNTGDGGYSIEDDYIQNCSVVGCGYDEFYVQDGSFDIFFDFIYDDRGNEIGYTGERSDFYHFIVGSGEDFSGEIISFSNSYLFYFDTGYEYNDFETNYVGFDVTSITGFPASVPASVPEPGTLALFGIGLFGMGLARRKRKV